MWRVNARLDIWDGHGNRDVVKRRIMSSLCRDGAVDARVLLMALAQFPKGRIRRRKKKKTGRLERSTFSSLHSPTQRQALLLVQPLPLPLPQHPPQPERYPLLC
jgi:hypothetical protein